MKVKPACGQRDDQGYFSMSALRGIVCRGVVKCVKTFLPGVLGSQRYKYEQVMAAE